MVRISDIQDNSVLWETVPYCDIKENEISTYLLQPNDILFARTGGTVGKSYLVQEVPEEAIYAGYLIRTRYSQWLCPQYLKFSWKVNYIGASCVMALLRQRNQTVMAKR